MEIGCATGQLTRELARRFDGKSRISAFDESEAFVAEARAKTDSVEDLRASTTFRVAEPRDLPADDQSADSRRLQPGGRRRGLTRPRRPAR